MRPCVLIPSYDNAGTIADVVRRARTVLEPVIVVDDGSTDGTGDRAREAGAEVVVHPRNLGKGRALATGLEEASRRGFTHAVALDGDGQHYPEDVPALVRAAEACPDGIVVGSRPWSGPNRSRGARFGRWFSNLWVRIDGAVAVEDSQCGFRVYPVEAVRGLPLRGSRYEWEMEVLVRAGWAGMPVVSAPIRVHYPPAGERVSHFRVLADNARISSVYALAFLLRPLLRPFARRPRALPRPEEDTGWSGQAQGSALGWHALFWIMRVLGRPAVYAMLRPISLWYALFAPRGRAGSADYLRRVLGWATPLHRLHRVRTHFQAFAVNLVDRVLLLSQGPSAFRIESVGTEVLRRHQQEGRGVVLLTSHLGNAEVAGIGLKVLRNIPVKLVMFQNEREEIRRFFARFGARMPEVIGVRPGGMASLEILRALRAGDVVAMKADRVVDENYVTVPFLGSGAPFPTGPFLVAAVARVPLFEIHCVKDGVSLYRVTVEGPRWLEFDRGRDRDAQIEAWVAAYAARLEAHVRRHPYQWFNFYRFWEPPRPPSISDAPTPGAREVAGP